MFLLKISSLLFHTRSHTLLAKNQHNSLVTLLTSSLYYSCQLGYLISPPTAYTPALLLSSLNIAIAPWKPVQLKYSPKLPAAYNFEWAGMEKEEKKLKFIPSFDEYTTSLRPHVSSLSHVTTVFQNYFYSQHQGLQLFLGNFWFSKQNKCFSDVLCSNDDFCYVEHYLL